MILASAATDIGRGLREAFYMFWQTFWALALGFIAAGALQAFVRRRHVERVMGNHRPMAVFRAAGFGMASSSCSYAASALAWRLFSLGADLVSSLIFMVASTNLVVELGIALLVLMGWQFLAGEFAGGALMIVVMALLGGIVISRAMVAVGRSRTEQRVDEHATSADPRLSVRKGIVNAAAFATADIAMVRREIVGGFIAAGLLAEIVPARWWSDFFLTGHGAWGNIESAFVGPIIAMIACVCSVGNVPLAAALWHEGIGFSGVISFIFADLLAAPLLLIYRRYYGTRLALRIVGLLYVAMVVAGLCVNAIFSAASIAPTHRNLAVFSEPIAFDATAILNIIFGAFLVGTIFVARRHDVTDHASPIATDPVCHMVVEKANAAAHIDREGMTYYFCSQGCAEHFAASADTALSD